MKMVKFFQTNKMGFSLVETMVVSAILGGLALVVSQMIIMQSKQTYKAEISYAKMEIQRTVVEFLKTKDVCSFLLSSNDNNIKSIRSPNIPSFEASSVFPYKINFSKIILSFDSNSVAIFEVGKNASTMSEILKVKEIYFSIYKYANSFPEGDFLSDFTLEFEPFKGKILEPIVLKNIPIKAVPIKAGSPVFQISKCGLWDHANYRRETFTNIDGKEISWKVPVGVSKILVSMSGGGGSGYGWKVTDDLQTGHSAGFIMNKSLRVKSGEVYKIKVGFGGRGLNMHARTTIDKKLYIQNPTFNYSKGDPDEGKVLIDTFGMRGYAGGSSYIRLDEPNSVPIIECSGGHGGYPITQKYKKAFTENTDTPVARYLKSEDYIPYLGNDHIATSSVNTWKAFSPGLLVNKNNNPNIALSLGVDYAKTLLPVLQKKSGIPTFGQCADINGIIKNAQGELGNKFTDFSPGFFNGADTSLGYGNGGDVRVYNGNVAYNYSRDPVSPCAGNDVQGCSNASKEVKGRLIIPQKGRDGIVYIDMW